MSRIVSVNVGRPQQVSVRRGRPVMSAIAKAPVDGRVRVAGVNLAGDAVEVLARPAHGVTVALVSAAILLDDSLRPRAAAAPELAEGLARYLHAPEAAA